MEPCPSQEAALLLDLACDPQLHHHDEVNVYLCLTCGSPVFRDDPEQESDLTSSFCSDCFSMFHHSNDIDLHDDSSSMTDIDMDDDDDDDHEDCNYFPVSCHAGSIALEGQALSSSMGFGFLNGGNTTINAA